MLRALYTSASGMKAQELSIDNTANNIANVNTSAFKRSTINFADLFYTTLEQPGTSVSASQTTPSGLQIGNGTRATSTTKVFTSGTIEQTGFPLDIAIEGDGFLKVNLPNNETRFTRAGSLRIDQNGQLVTADGYPIEPAISIPDGTSLAQLNIAADGTVSAPQSGSPSVSNPIGQIQLFRFLNPAGLSSEGGNLYAETPASGQEVSGTPGLNGLGNIRQGFLEGSNVEVVTELISLISAQRAYEVNSRAIKAGDEMLSTATDIVR
ncbi:MAG: flagellar basal-body rod protein FlgG [Planctomycetaceae bacterium]|nr:flagellar basal-body rod protein FlgG [Planctomycetaceae bacterium]MCA9030097.1 flagellar basal-body rod protein FlgG [Planctomycetaceae bacterium]MCB9952695.1 flagellar basal-body rod protein FlgG [Planctomycetaceae bacterium]